MDAAEARKALQDSRRGLDRETDAIEVGCHGVAIRLRGFDLGTDRGPGGKPEIELLVEKAYGKGVDDVGHDEALAIIARAADALADRGRVSRAMPDGDGRPRPRPA